MEQKRSMWKETLNYGIIMGLVTVVFSVLTYMFDLTFKTWIIWPTVLLGIIVLFFLLRSYRDHYNNGYIAYGKSVGAGVIINIYSALIAAVYIYLLYSVIDPDLVDKSLAISEERMQAMMAKRGLPEGSLDAMMDRQAKRLTPWFITLTATISSICYGVILSLIVSLFIMEKGNPLLDEVEEEPKQ